MEGELTSADYRKLQSLVDEQEQAVQAGDHPAAPCLGSHADHSWLMGTAQFCSKHSGGAGHYRKQQQGLLFPQTHQLAAVPNYILETCCIMLPLLHLHEPYSAQARDHLVSMPLHLLWWV